ncbi:MAG: hypothetical protein OCD02_04405 [Spirochaetaceae bacterium]
MGKRIYATFLLSELCLLGFLKLVKFMITIINITSDFGESISLIIYNILVMFILIYYVFTIIKTRKIFYLSFPFSIFLGSWVLTLWFNGIMTISKEFI